MDEFGTTNHDPGREPYKFVANRAVWNARWANGQRVNLLGLVRIEVRH